MGLPGFCHQPGIFLLGRGGVLLCPGMLTLPSCRSTMAGQQAQMLLSMNSLEAVNAGVQQNNTESFAVVLCHLAELHAEQVKRQLPLLEVFCGETAGLERQASLLSSACPL